MHDSGSRFINLLANIFTIKTADFSDLNQPLNATANRVAMAKVVMVQWPVLAVNTSPANRL